MRQGGTLLENLPRVLSGRYEVVRVLGQGGMGLVCLGRQLGLDREVAIKFLHPEGTSSRRMVTRFKREAEVAKRLTHPNTVRLYDFGETPDGTLYLVMEHLKGHTLEAELVLGGPLAAERVARLARQVLKSLVEAHALGIVHRDIKPSNLMLCEQVGEKDLVKVLDFGVAHFPTALAAGTATAEGTMVGTAAYMAPEQARGEGVDARSDLYSLGVTLLELLTGRLPIAGNSPMEMALRHASSSPIEIPPALEQLPLGRVIRRALAKDRSDRYPSAEAMLEDLDGFAETPQALVGVERTLSKPLPIPSHDGATTPESELALTTPEPGEAERPDDPILARAAATPDPRPAGIPGRWRVALAAALLAGVGMAAWTLLHSPNPTDIAPAPEQRMAGPRVIDPQRITERRLTNLPDAFGALNGALAPDGGRIAYVDAQYRLWVQGLDDVAPTAIPVELGGAGSLEWFPDGRHLLASHGNGGLGPMLVVDIETAARREIAQRAAYGRPSPDGLSVAYQDGQAILVMAAAGGESRAVLPGTFSEIYLLDWSPSGEFLAVSGERPPQSLFAVSVEDSRIISVYTGPRLGSLLSGTTMGWLDDANILFTRHFAGGDMGTELCHTTFPDTGRAPDCFWRWDDSVRLSSSAIAGRVLVDRTQVQFDVFLAELAEDGAFAEEPVRLTNDERADVPGPWLDAQSLAVVGVRDGWRLLRYRVAVGQVTSRPVEAGVSEVWAAADPDGHPLVWRSLRRVPDGYEGCELWRLHPDGRATRVTVVDRERPCVDPDYFIGAPGAPSFYDLRCAAARCVLAEFGLDFVRFSELDWRAGTVSPAFHEAATADVPISFDLSPDGETLAWVPASTSEIHLTAVAQADRRAVVSMSPFVYGYHVAFDHLGRSLYVTGGTETDYVLLQCDLTGTCRALLSDPLVAVRRPRPSPDGRYLAFGVRSMEGDLWLMDGL